MIFKVERQTSAKNKSAPLFLSCCIKQHKFNLILPLFDGLKVVIFLQIIANFSNIIFYLRSSKIVA